MLSLALRAGRWPLALVLAVLTACGDDPAAPTPTVPLAPHAALGDVFTVTNTNDLGIGSLRWALSHTTGGETIRFDPALGGQTIALDSSLRIAKPVAIEGPAGTGITLTTGGKGFVILTSAQGVVTLRNLSITGGAGAISGGTTDVVVENSAIYGNHSTNPGDVINVHEITLINSTVSGNTSPSGSFIYYTVVGVSKIALINSTIAHNTAHAAMRTGSVGTVVIRNSILSNNSGTNCVGLTSLITRIGSNISDDDTCGGPTEIVIADPQLDPLGDNGGPTWTHALRAGSPAINVGTSCSEQVDQRYMPRDAACDLGAFEFADFTTVALTVDPGVGVNQTTGWAVLTGTLKCSRNETFSLELTLSQEQKVGRQRVEVHAVAIVPVTCSTTARPWSSPMVLSSGAFQNGAATVTALTAYAEPWVAPAAVSSPVKLFWSRK